jgi:hypothetical protein
MKYHIEDFSFESYLIKDHAAMRMIYRNIKREELEELLGDAEVVENYPLDFPFPSKLILKMINNRPLHAVVAFSEVDKTGIIVTLYEPDLIHFEPDFKTRRKI